MVWPDLPVKKHDIQAIVLLKIVAFQWMQAVNHYKEWYYHGILGQWPRFFFQ
jgi:hypothetical protein